MTVYHDIYRPNILEDMVGQKAAIKAMEGAIKKDRSKAFLFTGPSGVGKTTLARIGAKMAGADETTIIEQDGARLTGVDEMRSLLSMIGYSPIMGGRRAIIVDECHRISKQAWETALKSIEEPPEHVSWFLCTTDPGKLPGTLHTRCVTIKLSPIAVADLKTLVSEVAEAEELELADGVLDVCVEEAHGSARQALVNLATALPAEHAKEARAMLRTPEATEPVTALCRLMLSGGSWSAAMALVKRMEGEEPEGIRIQICNYMAKVLLDATPTKAPPTLTILDHFSKPYHPGEKLAPLMLSIGRALFGE